MDLEEENGEQLFDKVLHHYYQRYYDYYYYYLSSLMITKEQEEQRQVELVELLFLVSFLPQFSRVSDTQ